MRLTVEEHPEAIKRYGHVKPARRTKSCAARCPGTRRTCTRGVGHRGPHVAHGSFHRVAAVWDTGTGAPGAAGPTPGARKAAGRSRPPAGRPIGLPAREPRGALEALKRGVLALTSSWDQIAFIVLFVVLVKLAIDVLMSLG